MNIARLPHDPTALADFYHEALEHLGAVCERTWHNRLELVAEGAAARLWNSDGSLHQTELLFPDPSETAQRNAATEVFPGCPLTFRVSKALRPHPMPFERGVIENDNTQVPAPSTLEKLWHNQFPRCMRWRLDGELQPAHIFTLLALMRCEIQAIDQHWSLHRVALRLPGGERDEDLATNISFARLITNDHGHVNWPTIDMPALPGLLAAAIETEIAAEIAGIRGRQENYLRRELDRIDDYFESYEAELTARSRRAGGSIQAAERLAAAKAEHARRRDDQVTRHEIRVVPHCDALLLLAEPAWEGAISFQRENQIESVRACFNPRARRWQILR